MSEAATAREEWKHHWPMVLAAMVGMSFYSFFAYSNQMFIEPLEREFGWPRAEISMGYTILALMAFLGGPFMGALIDRLGARPIAIPGMFFATLAFGALSFAGGPVWTWFALWLLLAIPALAVKTTIWSSAISNAFSTGRGLALAVMLSGSALAQFLGPILANWLIENHGWRAAYRLLALGWGGLGLVLVLAWFKDVRQTRLKTEKVRSMAVPLPGLTFRKAISSKPIILIFTANLLLSLLGSGVTFHLKPILVETGLTSDKAAMTAALAGLSGIAGKLITGWLLDRIEGNVVPVFSFGIGALGYFLLLDTLNAYWAVALGVLVLGYHAGAGLGVSTYLVSRYTGLRAFGAVYGAFGSMLMLGTAIGPVIAGRVHDIAHSYHPLLITVIPVGLASAALLLGLGRYPDFTAPDPARASHENG